MNSRVAESFRQHLDIMQTRLAAALAQAGLDVAIIHAGTPPVPVWDDQPYPFRPHPHFLQWCPLPEAPGSALVLEPGSRPRLILVQPKDFWHAPPAPPDGAWADAFDVDVVATTEARDRQIARTAGRLAMLGDTSAAAGSVASAAADAGSAIAGRCLDYQRAVKTAYEIACIAEANRLAAAGHLAVETPFADGGSESDIDFAYLRGSAQHAADLPYPNIVALNAHAAVLHYQHLDTTAPPRADTLLIDAGARCAGYAADITRTHLSPDSPLRELRAAMETLQQTLCREAVAGVEFLALHERAHELLADLLAEHGLVRCGADEALARGITRVFLPHGLGHLLGLQVHDVAGWQREALAPATRPPAEHPYLRLTRRLEAGFVVTIEPGLYFIESLCGALPAAERALIDMARFETLVPSGGIRIEDDVAVEAGDNTNLTRAAFARIDSGATPDAPDRSD